MLKLTDQLALVVGAGSIGLRRVETLLNAGAKVKLITGANFCDESQQFQDIKSNSNSEIICADYDEKYLSGCSIVFACTDNRDVNTQISQQARQAGILVNAADQNDDCDFYMPAIVQDKDVVVAIGTGGQAPALTGLLKRRVKKALPDQIGSFAELIDEYRQDLKTTEPDSNKRMQIMKKLCDEKTLEEFRTGSDRGVRFRYALAISGQLDNEDKPIDPAPVSGHPVLGTLKLLFLGILIALPFIWLGSTSKIDHISKLAHIIFSIAGSVAITFAAWFGFKYLKQAERLREKNPDAILKPGSSLETLDIRCRRILHSAFVLLTSAIVIGAYIATKVESQNWFASFFAKSKLLAASLVWVFALLACMATFAQKFKAKQIAKLTIFAFILSAVLAVVITLQII